jgi:predicted RecB family nuclease
MRHRRECPRGHVYFKSSTCPVCPRCEAKRKPAAGFLAGLAAPARRALEGAGVTTLRSLAACSEGEVAKLHGMGPSAVARLKAVLKEAGLGFSRD